MYAMQRTLRLADGPDEVHRAAIGKFEIGKYVPKEMMRSGQSGTESSFIAGKPGSHRFSDPCGSWLASDDVGPFNTSTSDSIHPNLNPPILDPPSSALFAATGISAPNPRTSRSTTPFSPVPAAPPSPAVSTAGRPVPGRLGVAKPHQRHLPLGLGVALYIVEHPRQILSRLVVQAGAAFLEAKVHRQTLGVAAES
jgi:hypothetical protein